MKKTLYLLLCISLIAGACNSAPKDSKENAEEVNEQKLDNTNLEDDAEYATKAADGGMMEVALGKIVQTNASSAVVKQFGTIMVNDHTKANEELKALAAKKNITLPTSLSNDKMEKISDFSKKHGAEFDKDYIEFMIEDHKEDIEHFTKASQNAKDAELKSWFAGKVPALQHHLQKAEEAQKSLK